MKREVRFNAWIPELGIMIEDVVVGHGNIGFGSDNEDVLLALKAKGYKSDDDDNLPEEWYDTGEDWYHVMNGFELVQFTGLKDKTGKEIYEGDIVVEDRYPFFDGGTPNYIGTIEWIFNGWQYVLHCINPEKRGISNGSNDQIEDEGTTNFEVIGNIYKNPELLNKD